MIPLYIFCFESQECCFLIFHVFRFVFNFSDFSVFAVLRKNCLSTLDADMLISPPLFPQTHYLANLYQMTTLFALKFLTECSLLGQSHVHIFAHLYTSIYEFLPPQSVNSGWPCSGSCKLHHGHMPRKLIWFQGMLPIPYGSMVHSFPFPACHYQILPAPIPLGQHQHSPVNLKLSAYHSISHSSYVCFCFWTELIPVAK